MLQMTLSVTDVVINSLKKILLNTMIPPKNYAEMVDNILQQCTLKKSIYLEVTNLDS